MSQLRALLNFNPCFSLCDFRQHARPAPFLPRSVRFQCPYFLSFGTRPLLGFFPALQQQVRFPDACQDGRACPVGISLSWPLPSKVLDSPFAICAWDDLYTFFLEIGQVLRTRQSGRQAGNPVKPSLEGMSRHQVAAQQFSRSTQRPSNGGARRSDQNRQLSS